MTRTRPEYRIRVFLAVDLAGSTAFKAKQSSASWIRVFRAFYSNFLKHFQSIYVEYCESHEECAPYKDPDFHPKIWKTVGDEIIFVNRIQSQFHLFAYVHAFDQTLRRYKEILKSKDSTRDLDVKGNGWIASFPFPNQTVKVYDPGDSEAEDEISDEKYEAEADINPAAYDFLGPGIDAGFRIAKNSLPGFFTLSPMLAWLLCRANTNRVYSKFGFKLEYRGDNILKGVVDGSPYPMVGINTERNERRNRIDKLRNDMLGGVSSDAVQIIEYLELFADEYDIEMPRLEAAKSDNSFGVPEFYSEKFIPDWERLKDELDSRDQNLAESSASQLDGSEESNDPDTIQKALQDLLAQLRNISDQDRST
jgi:hypothetical protein